MNRMLRLSLLLCALTFINLVSKGQSQYLDASFNVISSANGAKYIREVEMVNDTLYNVVLKYMTGDVMMIGSYSDAKLETENGQFKYFYANGNPESEGHFKNGNKVGTWKRWSFDGTRKPDRYYPDENFKAKTRSTNPAKFPGGTAALQKLIADSLKYPEEAKERGLEGTVYVTFTVDATGEVSRPEVSEGVHYLLNEEAMRFVSSMPTWSPASKNGIPIDSNFIMPITFSLKHEANSNQNKKETNNKTN
ncbi:MAG TPA: TonB family protein [Flavobacteriales bacterium]